MPESAKHNFPAIEGRMPFEDPNFGFLTVRTSIVYTVCNIREILAGKHDQTSESHE